MRPGFHPKRHVPKHFSTIARSPSGSHPTQTGIPPLNASVCDACVYVMHNNKNILHKHKHACGYMQSHLIESFVMNPEYR